MKAETTPENRARFFALYWEQQVAKIRCFDHLIEVSNRIYKDEGYPVIDATEYIVLKPLSAISDEDAIEVADMLTLKSNLIKWEVCKPVYTNAIKAVACRDYQVCHLYKDLSFGSDREHGFEGEYTRLPQVVDFLRSRGYALPWMGLSVEELIASGWVKLIEL